MALSKERLRKIHGIPEPTGIADPVVLARRKYHDAAARWMARYTVLLSFGAAFLGIVGVVLPVIWSEWRFVIESVPVIRSLFHDFSRFRGMAMNALYFMMLLFLVRTWLAKYLPCRDTVGVTYRDIVDMELFPRTKKEEVAYWVDFLFNILCFTVMVFIFASILAYALNPRI